MNKIVKIVGLNCGHCAQKLEAAISKLKIIKNVSVNFLKSTIEFESDDVKLALKQIIKLTKKFEPEAQIIDEEVSKNCDAKGCHLGKKEHKHNHKKHDDDCCCCMENHTKKTKKKGVLVDVLFLGIGLVFGVLSAIFSSEIVVHYLLLFASVLCLGWKVYLKAFRLILKGIINENLLLTISVFGAIAIQKDMEGIMVIALYSIGKILEGLAVNKSRNAIEKITNFKPEYAVVIINGEEIKVNPSEVKIGEKIIIRPGENVPIDCEILQGQTNLNTQSLTGESLPVFAQTGDKVMSGSIVMDGMIIAKTTALYKDSMVSKILNLIENNQQKKSKVETVISKITKWYTLGVICASILTFGIVFLVTESLKTAFYRGLIFLVISCPCAFAISVPLSYFSGLGNASSKGILIKGTVFLDACAKIKTVVFDKTGTLTTGRFEIEKIVIEQKNLTEKDVIKLAAIGEQYSIHPLAKKITESAGKRVPSAEDVKEVAGEGVYYSYNSNKYFVGRKTKNIEKTCVELFENNKLLARIYLHDNIKETSKKEINSLKKMGIKTVLLSGDKSPEVQKIAEEIMIDEYKSELLPQEKSRWIEDEKAKSAEHLAFVGDGLNDAPSLTLADVGFCMGLEGNPASVEASDIVLSDDNPEKISKAIKISKFTRKIVWQNIGFSAFIKLLFLSLGAFGITGMLAAVIADVGVTVLAILNSLRALYYKP